MLAEMTFKQEIILAIIKGIGIAAIVGSGGCILNFLLEKYKTKQAIREEAARLRMLKISEVWNGLEEIHAKLIQVGKEIIDIKLKDKRAHNEIDILSEDAIETIRNTVDTKLLNIINEQIESMKYKIHSYRFWLGNRLFEEHVSQLNALSALSRAIGNNLIDGKVDFKLKEIKNAVSLVESTKKDIVEIVRYL